MRCSGQRDNYVLDRTYADAHAPLDELTGLADEKDASCTGKHRNRGARCAFSLTGKASDAVRAITSGIDLASVHWSSAL